MTFVQSSVRISCVEMTFSMVIRYTEPVSDGTVCELHKSDVPENTKATIECGKHVVGVENIVGVIVLLTDVCLLVMNQDYLFYYTTVGYDAY